MKKLLIIFLSILCLTGCFKRDDMENINIYTTIYPITYITERLYGEYSNIESIYPDGVNVQLENCEQCSNLLYTLTDKQLSDYSKTDLFIFNSLLYEGKYVEPMFKNNKNLKIINATDNLLENEFYGLEEIWLDPTRLLTIARNIKKGFDEYIDNYYLKQNIDNNFNILKEELDKLGARFADLTNSADNKILVTNDEVFNFLSKEKYGLTVYVLNENSTQKTIDTIKNLINEGKVKYIYIKQYDEINDTINNLIENTDIEVIKLHMLTNLTENEISNKQDYFTIMNQNIEELKKQLYNYGGIFMFILIVVLVIIVASIKQIDEYERGVKFTTGKFSKIMEPGWRFVMPIFQSFKKVDIRTKAVDVPEQEAITKDNVSVKINAVLYYKVFDASKAILAVENFRYAVSQLAQTTMRNAVGAVSLDDLLGEREKISGEICKIIDEATDPWGIKVENVELKDISLPEEMKRVIAKAAEAEREKIAVITKAQGEVEASQNLAKAAEIMSTTPGALHLRTLSTLNDLSSDQSNTIIFAVPIEVLRAFEGSDITKVIKK